jgi:hypothetical protein
VKNAKKEGEEDKPVLSIEEQLQLLLTNLS